jgi:DNA polymerase V
MDHSPRLSASPVYALVDGNSFYCSCEQAFRPDLAGRAVVVASNNDGCVVARNAQAKALGIPMAVPLWQLKPLIKAGKIVVFSSNYELYADLSARMMAAIASLVPAIFPYSVDECFADLSGLPDPYEVGREIRARVGRWTQIPTGVGIAPTATLAKFANYLAKKVAAFDGVCHWQGLSPDEQAHWLESQPVQTVWGIGRHLAPRLAALGIRTARDLQQADPRQLRAHFGVMVERSARDLAGTPCLAIAQATPPRQQLLRSRSFGQPVTRLSDLQAALAHHVAAAAEALRRQHSVAGMLSIDIRTNAFRSGDPQYYGYDTIGLPSPTADTLTLTRAALALLQRNHRPGYASLAWKATACANWIGWPQTTRRDAWP